jgi:hypothetical protein
MAMALSEPEPPPHLDPPRRVAQRKLEAIVDLDEHLAADILKQMLRGERGHSASAA